VWFDVIMAVTMTGIKAHGDGGLTKQDGYGFHTGDDQVSNCNLVYAAASTTERPLFASPLNDGDFQDFDVLALSRF
jgi:hypothetical protein